MGIKDRINQLNYSLPHFYLDFNKLTLSRMRLPIMSYIERPRTFTHSKNGRKSV